MIPIATIWGIDFAADAVYNQGSEISKVQNLIYTVHLLVLPMRKEHAPAQKDVRPMTRELLESGEQFQRNPAGAKFSKELLVINSDDLAVHYCVLDCERINILLLVGGNGDIFGRTCFDPVFRMVQSVKS
jgi:hypothetical protein